MDTASLPPPEARARWTTLAWLAGLAVLFTWHAAQTLSVFGASLGQFAPLLDDQPVLSGQHPQHQYLGSLGSQSLLLWGHACAYDPAFQAGYPKTPIFSGSRFADLFQLAGGGGFRPAAYKVGLALACWLVPVFVLLTALAVGLRLSSAVIACATALALWWGPLGQNAMASGDLDVILASLATLAHFGLLMRFHHAAGPTAWLGLVITAALGWFLQPMLLPIVLPLLLVYYLSAGVRHSSMTWHLGLATAELFGLGVNLFWLTDWFFFWWVRNPLALAEGMLAHRTFRTVWEAPLWCGGVERALALVLLASGLAGCVLWHYSRQRSAARVWGVGIIVLFILAVLGISLESLGQLGTAALLLPCLWFACLPAAHLWTWGVGRCIQSGRVGGLVLGSVGFVAAGYFVFDNESVMSLCERIGAPRPLDIGLSERQERVIARLRQDTTGQARILWEDRHADASSWTALLPLWTGRSFLGGLDADTIIVHSTVGLRDGHLAGLPIGACSETTLVEYCRRYNIGWVAARTPSTLDRLDRWAGARRIGPLEDGGGWLFAVTAAPRSYVLKGKAELIHADSKYITLADVVPEQGVVILSLHYQKGLRATPSRVIVEPEHCPLGQDPIGFVRLRVAGHVARVTLRWEE